MYKFPLIKVLPQKRKPDGADGFLVEVEGYLASWMSNAEFREVFPNVNAANPDWQEF